MRIVELDELYWFLEYKSRTETRENIYIMTMVSRKPRQIVGHTVSRNKLSRTIQRMVDAAPEAEYYCTDGYLGYQDGPVKIGLNQKHPTARGALV